jgi:hypothetical protein
MFEDLSQYNWVMIGGALVVLVVGWTIVKTVFKLTARVFTLGCVGLVILGAIMGGLALFSQ